jgi:hypothetical protein
MIADVEHRLISTYEQAIPRDQIATLVRDAHARFEHSPVRDFVPLLVERRACAELGKFLQPAVAE